MTFDPNARPAPDQPSYAALLRQLQEVQSENRQLKRTKKFGLVWEDKPDAQVERVFLEAPLLCEDREKAVVTDEDAVNHVLINGDNFHALTALRATHTGKVDVIYIDPPYNTGNKDFIYNDDYVDAEDGYRHSKWLSFMEKRLRLARELMSASGAIIVAIGNDEIHRLRMLMDGVFGDSNFISQVTWAGDIKNDARFVSNTSDYMLIYVKDKSHLVRADARYQTQKSGVREMLDEAARIWTDTEDATEATKRFKAWFRSQPADGSVKAQKGNAAYQVIDDKGRLFGSDNLSWPGGGGPRYDVLHPATGQPVAVPSRGWRAVPATMDRWLSEGRILFGPDHTTGVRYKRFLDDVQKMSLRDEFYASRADANKLLARVLGPNIFPYPKDHNVLAQWIDYVSAENSNATVLDFFAGSGTTAHAVAELNKADGGRRQCILVTDGGKTESTGHSGSNANDNAVHIAEEITYERVRRVLTGQDWADGRGHEPLGGNLRYFNVHMENIQPYSERDEAAAFAPFTRSHASIATSAFTVVEEKQVNTAYGLPIDYTILSAPVGEGEVKYVVAVQAHDYELAELGEWFAALPEDADVTIMGHWLEEVEWIKENTARIKLVDVMEQVSASRKHAKSLVYT